MSEKSEESIYQVASRLGAEILTERTGKKPKEIVKRARAESKKKHRRTPTTTLSTENIIESQQNIDKAFKKLQEDFEE